MQAQILQGKIKDQLPLLHEKYHVKKLGIFGSFARGEQNPESDVDIIVEFESPVGFFEFIRLENYLSEILGAKVDLVTERALKPSIKESVLQETVYV